MMLTVILVVLAVLLGPFAGAGAQLTLFPDSRVSLRDAVTFNIVFWPVTFTMLVAVLALMSGAKLIGTVWALVKIRG